MCGLVSALDLLQEVRVVQVVLYGFECQGFTGVISCDLSRLKAFDVVDHGLLLRKFKFYGIDNLTLRLVESYVCNREQFVSVNGESSQRNLLYHGVTQG